MPPSITPPVPLRPSAAGHRVRAAAGAALALVLLAGCGLFGSDDAPDPTTTTAAPTTTTTAPPVARSQPPELLDAGDEPRQALRVAYTEGDTATVTFTSDLEISQESDGRTQRIDSPPIAQTLTYEVGAVSDDGAELTIRIDAMAAKGKGTGLTDDELAAIDDRLAPLVGLEATALATPLGELDDVAFDVPDDLSEALTAQLAALTDQLPALGPALPSEPVGVGASWRTTSTTTLGGAEVETTSTVAVTEIDGGTLRYTATIRTSADAQDIALAGLADGTTARLDSSDVQGTTTGSLGLDHVGFELRTQLQGEQALTLTSDAGSTALTQTVAIAYVAVTEPE